LYAIIKKNAFLRGLSMARDLKVNGGEGGVEQITMAEVAASVAGSDQECTEVTIVNPNANSFFLNIGAAAVAATGFEIPQNVPVQVAVLNTNQINLIGTATEKVNLLWRK